MAPTQLNKNNIMKSMGTIHVYVITNNTFHHDEVDGSISNFILHPEYKSLSPLKLSNTWFEQSYSQTSVIVPTDHKVVMEYVLNCIMYR